MKKKMTQFGFTVPQLDQDLPTFERRTVPVPEPTGRQLLVEVKAVSVNPTDLATRAMKKENDNSFTVLGRDVSGTVVASGPDSDLFKVGDDVFYPGSTNLEGTMADYHVVDERMVAMKPRNLTHAEAAALPLTALTSYEVFHDRLSLFETGQKPEETTLLIVGASGGVGSIASQIALNYGFRVIGTASREDSINHLKKMGLKHVINHKEAFKEQLEELGIESVDAILLAAKADDNSKEAGKVIKPQGRICSLLPLKQPLPMSYFGKSIQFSYELMYTRSVYETPDWIKQHEYLTELKNQVEQGLIKTTLSKSYLEMNEDTITDAFTALKTGHTIGKIVLNHSK
ncbi:zinc-binding alcohol dehydrogenase family protein [Alkalibacterium sp. MB6]|uniref:zinc-binding alcohol dehydrogenase family protein n=1 Tax=Alkalibacterium sp. MB6 TaxID=2081965 RepID=UPI00137ADF1B|nr:zinc-binding alcohol dehydrogenase family protein [Alkalibacterium sp. MB6]